MLQEQESWLIIKNKMLPLLDVINKIYTDMAVKLEKAQSSDEIYQAIVDYSKAVLAREEVFTKFLDTIQNHALVAFTLKKLREEKE